MQPKKDICLNSTEIIQNLYDNIYKIINNNIIDVFLCGGKSKKNEISVRDKINDKLYKTKEVRLLYPEDLFIEMLNTNKSYNMLDLENFLADNCDLICIICESPGALVELGAFVNSEKIINKVVAVVEKNKSKKQSFIMLGPIKLIKQKNTENLIQYEKSKLDLLSEKLLKRFLLFKREQEKNKNTNKKIDTIIGLYYFIPLLLFFYITIESHDLANAIRKLQTNNGIIDKKFDTTYSSALKLLQKERLIEKKTHDDLKVYCLTKRGSKKILEILKNVNIKNKTTLCDKLRFDIMNKKYYHS